MINARKASAVNSEIGKKNKRVYNIKTKKKIIWGEELGMSEDRTLVWFFKEGVGLLFLFFIRGVKVANSLNQYTNFKAFLES